MADYTTIDDPSAHFQVQTYTGSGAPQDITNTGNSDLQPDMVWTKIINSVNGAPNISDSSRGVSADNGKWIRTDSSDVESDDANGIRAFNSDGFKTGDGWFNGASGSPYIAWQLKANGGTKVTVAESGSGSGCVNACTHQANTTAGFSIITYTGRDDELSNGQESNLTHGLGVAPTFTIMKRRDTAAGDLHVMGKNVTTSSAYSNNEFVALNTNGAINGSSYTGDTAPDSTHIFLGNELVNIADATYVCYAFTDVQGFSKFGKYIGNGDADGPFVYLGFRPAFVMIRQLLVAAGDDWIMYDKERGENPVIKKLFANSNAAESSSYDTIDILSNGFKVRTDLAGTNTSTRKYIYVAFAENPFVSSTDTNSIPATAR